MTVPLDDTICAVATPSGEGGIGIIRLSGNAAVFIARKIVRIRSGVSLELAENHRMYMGDVFSGSPEEKDAQKSIPLDEALIVVMRSPRSYTGEDVIEIHTHGGPLVLESICDVLIREGARLAEPGEFTKRAFLNGRLDLTQAEAVLDTIQATTSSSLKAAQCQLRGVLAGEVDRLRSEIIRLLAHIEAGMDFVEEDISFIEMTELSSSLQCVNDDLSKLLDSFKEGRIIREGIKVAIIGCPNVGKSSLLNSLLRVDRAIVSPQAGTTRDVLDEVVSIKGVAVRVVDTAGLREARDPIEGEGVRRTRAAISEADLLLVVIDSSRPLTEEDTKILREHGSYPLLVVLNKRDLPPEIIEQDVEHHLNITSVQSTNNQEKVPVVWLSAKTGVGVEELRETIRAQVLRNGFEPGASILVTKLRHQSALQRAKDAILQALVSLEKQMAGECLAVDLRTALDCLGEITGEVNHEDILDRIFRDFCIGK